MEVIRDDQVVMVISEALRAHDTSHESFPIGGLTI